MSKRENFFTPLAFPCWVFPYKRFIILPSAQELEEMMEPPLKRRRNDTAKPAGEAQDLKKEEGDPVPKFAPEVGVHWFPRILESGAPSNFVLFRVSFFLDIQGDTQPKQYTQTFPDTSSILTASLDDLFSFPHQRLFGLEEIRSFQAPDPPNIICRLFVVESTQIPKYRPGLSLSNLSILADFMQCSQHLPGSNPPSKMDPAISDQQGRPLKTRRARPLPEIRFVIVQTSS
jgi:hypothetical protein